MIFGFDTETFPIQPGILAPEGVVLSYYARDSAAELVLFPDAVKWFRDRLEAGDTLVAHNSAYDLAVIAAADPTLLDPIFDALEAGRLPCTLVRGKMIDIARGEHKYRVKDDGKRIITRHSLVDMKMLYLGKFATKKGEVAEIRTGFGKLKGVPPETWPPEYQEYAKEDAVDALDVFDAQNRYVASDPLFPNGQIPNVVEQECAAFAMHLMGVWGVMTDAAAVAELKARLLEKLDGADAFLLEKGLARWVGKSSPKLVKDTEAIRTRVWKGFMAQGKRVPRTDKGQISISDEAKIESGDKDLVKMATYTLSSKLLDTYVPRLEEGTRVPINARWNVLLETGRTSCSEPNLQNPPGGTAGVRECYVPRKGYVYAQADYPAIELRALAQICLDLFGESGLAEAFRRGEDPHNSLAAKILGCSLEQASDAKITINGEEKPLRTFCKVQNFGWPGGMGEETFVEYAKSWGFIITQAEAKRHREDFFRADPTIKRYLQWISRQVPNDKATIRQLRSGRIRGGVKFTSAANGHFQGLAADGAKSAMWLITRDCYKPGSPLYGSHIAFFLHDEFIVEVPEGNATAAARRMTELMQKGMCERWITDVPVPVPEPTLMRRWSKEAKSEVGPDELLTIWG
jgi:DNA polymerase I